MTLSVKKMMFLLKLKWKTSFLRPIIVPKQRQQCVSFYSTIPPALPSSTFRDLCNVVCNGTGSLDDLELSLSKVNIPLTSSLVTRVLESCKHQAATRRLLRFFLWSRTNLESRLEDGDFNFAIRYFAETKDFTSIDILISDFGKDGRAMETTTFAEVAHTLVKLGREDQALGIFKNLKKFKCTQDSATVTAIVSALCAKGHVERAERVIWHHKDAVSCVKLCIYRNLLYGWCVRGNVKEARRIVKDMNSSGIMPDLYCFNTFLRCICKRSLKSNPSALVPSAFNLMMEMKTYNLEPTVVTYNILLSSLSKCRRVKESIKILDTMKNSGCSPDWFSYYLVARVLYLTGRFGIGKRLVDEMVEVGIVPEGKFYYDLIGVLCGVERPNYALELFELMKKSSLGGYGPIYDLIIPKLCRGGDFIKARELWNEATAMGVDLQVSSDVLDPSVTEVFKPTRKVEDKICTVNHTKSKRILAVLNNLKRGRRRRMYKKKHTSKQKNKA
ncbi:pentatricopeptide repeat-containing protein At5g61370, mitochondrial [Daucus carota subsp. sativus]|nr:PREDICTED: pentatricopeptide repeat-containing protein At5g61370, mitochondrial [Daucus carota subsp. sativus]XP_017249886.1 PREDICTED: pentatricopeptide repeat-containing protein At5g61370, mitochondrial [Daucus carota subsp. sativus]XP_017249887.1 PREDICTED: pentatricopeptide repeat-containing protein At5g61370, mitochondrial [Daucus carota subsp. sativus]